MIELTMLPGKDGDCLLLSYGEGPELRRVLVDAGRSSTYDLIQPVLAALDPPRVDLVVVTHVDQDHVLGVLRLFEDDARVEVGEVWFNGFAHLGNGTVETFGPRDGELLTTALFDQDVRWNAAFDGRAVEVGRDPRPTGDGARFSVVAPDRRLLERLEPVWDLECRRHGLIPGVPPVVPAPAGFEQFGTLDIDALSGTPFAPDPSKTNASSIAFLFEYDGVRILFTGDGDDACIVDSLRPIAEAEGGRLKLDALKVAHHGSAGNVSRALLDLLDCRRYLISTNGSRHQHPDPVAMARILAFGGPEKEIVFNYRDRAQLWENAAWMDTYDYTVTGPPGPDGVVTLTW